MEINPPRSSVINSKKLGSKLTGNKLYAKLISLNITVANRILKDRNKYWFVVEGADLQVKIFSFTKNTVADVTDEYLEEDDIHYFEGHTIFSACFSTKALSLVIAWYAVTPERVAPFYTHSYFVNAEPVIVSAELLQAIYSYLLPPQPGQYENGAEADRDDMELDQTAHNVEGFTVFGNEYSETTNEQHEPPYYDRQHYNNNTPLSDPTALEHTNENHPFGVFNAFNNNTPTVVDYEEAFDPYIHTNTANNTNVVHEAQGDTENNTNVRHNVNNTLNKPGVVVGKPVVKKSGVSQRYQRIVIIKATELRRWTWEAEVLDEHPAIKCDELYMCGGQAVNSVILQCKQKMYERYPDDDIYFELQVRPRRKLPLQLQGQKFLNAVMSAWWSKQPESVTIDEPSNTNIATDHPIPVNVTDDNTVVIMVFELEYPESHEHHACWIIQACDDDKQLAIELRTETYSLDERAALITEMKQRVRARLARDVYYHDITFKEDIQLKRPDRLSAWAYWWLGAATTRATTFANWAGRVLNYFAGNNNNNNQNQL